MTDSVAKSHTIRAEIVNLLPALRAFSLVLAKNRSDADDLVQETLVRALRSLHQYTPGSRLKSWMFTIMRNVHRSSFVTLKRESTNRYGILVARLQSEPTQNAAVDLADLRAALVTLPAEQQEVLILVGGLGFTYEDAAEVSGCAVGTIKSRLNRGRERLAQLLAGTPRLPSKTCPIRLPRALECNKRAVSGGAFPLD